MVCVCVCVCVHVCVCVLVCVCVRVFVGRCGYVWATTWITICTGRPLHVVCLRAHPQGQGC